MKNKIRLLISFFTVLCVIFCLSISVSAEPRYSDNCSITLKLTYSSSGASCYARIKGNTGTTSISNCNVTLTDSSGDTVKSWTNLSANGTTLIFSKTASGVTKGETYTLSVTATVKRNGSSETVSDSVTRTY